MQYADPRQTLLFFDWDNTLFPSTELFKRWGVPSHPEKPPGWQFLQFTEEQQLDLERWRSALFQYLTIACGLSERCVIVTNSTRPWVETCVEAFAPNIIPLIGEEPGRVRIKYALEELLPRGLRPVRLNSDDWPGVSEEERDERRMSGKYMAMRKEAADFYTQYRNQTWKNIVSIGDMRYERDAAQELAFQRERESSRREQLRTKLFVTASEPSISYMTLQHQIMRLLLPVVVQFNGDIDVDFRCTHDYLQALSDALQMPELMSLPFPWDDPSLPVQTVRPELLDETAIIAQNVLSE